MTKPTTRALGAAAAAGYIGTIIAANWAVHRYGIVPVGFGLAAPAGVYFIGLALVLRDYVQWSLGKVIMLGALAVGVGVSYGVAGATIATASAAAFLFSELADFGLFTWIAPRWAPAVLIGGLVGAVIDSAIFLQLAFHSLDHMNGQILGKAYGITAAAIIIAVRRRAVLREPDPGRA